MAGKTLHQRRVFFALQERGAANGYIHWVIYFLFSHHRYYQPYNSASDFPLITRSVSGGPLIIPVSFHVPIPITILVSFLFSFSFLFLFYSLSYSLSIFILVLILILLLVPISNLLLIAVPILLKWQSWPLLASIRVEKPLCFIYF